MPERMAAHALCGAPPSNARMSSVAPAEDYEGFPMTRAYVESLPAGLDAYPETVIKGSMARGMIELRPENFDAARLPAPIKALFDNPPLVSDWFPEAKLVAMSCAMREGFFESDEQYIAWVRQGLHKVFSGPLYRVVFALISPTRLVKSSTRRWGALRRGTQRELVELNENGNLGRVRYPAGLYNELYAQVVLAGLLAIYSLSRAPNPLGSVLEVSEHSTLLEVIYDRDRPRGPALPS